MGNRFVHSACLMVWLAAIAGGGATESTPGAATPDADAGRDASSSLRPVRLRCEYLANPLGIAVREPRLSWALESEQNGQFQTAYRIRAASSEQRLAAGQGTGVALVGVARLTLSAVPAVRTKPGLVRPAAVAGSLHRSVRPEAPIAIRVVCR